MGSLGGVTDYFNLASTSLVPFESDEGTNRAHLVTRHYGWFRKGQTPYNATPYGAEATSPADWRNPTVKYMVVGDMTLSVTLGKAFAAKKEHVTTLATGYMITSASVETRARRFPVVTVRGTANEGADAINRFVVSVPVLARARPQNFFDVRTGGGRLQTCSLMATCDPVVLSEGMMPCASDVVGGRYEFHAESQANGGEDAPTVNAASGFVSLGAPTVGAGADYKRYRLTAVREMLAS